MDRKTRIITRQDVESVLNVASALPVVEEAFRLHGLGQTVMPPKLYLDIPSHGGDFRAMPGYLRGADELAGLKWVNVHPGNRNADLPTVMAVLVFSEPATGFPLAIMDATYITRIRTGAAGGVATKYLARRDSRTIGLVGCGAQAETQLLATLANLDRVERIVAFDAREASAQAFAERMGVAGLSVEIARNIETCVRDADVLITTTPVREPIVKAAWVQPGCHINAIGADAAGKEELEPDVLKNAMIVVDEWAQASHSGEINVPVARGLIGREDIHGTLGEVVAGLRPGRQSHDVVTVFDSTGLAIQDIATAGHVYHACVARDIGIDVSLL